MQELTSLKKPNRKTKKCISLDKKVKIKHYREKNYIKVDPNKKKGHSKNSFSLHESKKMKSGYLLKKGNGNTPSKTTLGIFDSKIKRKNKAGSFYYN